MRWTKDWAIQVLRPRWAHVAVFGGYVVLSLLVGEVHPFTRVSMYDSFPNWAYVFYLKDGQGNILFFRKEKRLPVDAGGLAHTFYSYNNQHGIVYGNGNEDEQRLLEVGNYMAQSVRDAWPPTEPHPQEIVVVRRHLYYRDKLMREEDKTIGHAVFTENN